KLERYIKDIEIEIQALKDLARTAVLPAAFKQQTLIGESIRNYAEASRAAGIDPRSLRSQSEELENISGLISDLRSRLEDLETRAEEAGRIESLEKKAEFCSSEIMTSCESIRKVCDR